MRRLPALPPLPLAGWLSPAGSELFDVLLVFAREVSQECLRLAVSYLPQCYDDVKVEEGCCSLQCRAAIAQVGARARAVRRRQGHGPAPAPACMHACHHGAARFRPGV